MARMVQVKAPVLLVEVGLGSVLQALIVPPGFPTAPSNGWIFYPIIQSTLSQSTSK